MKVLSRRTVLHRQVMNCAAGAVLLPVVELPPNVGRPQLVDATLACSLLAGL
jgi:hypothetical protein